MLDSACILLDAGSLADIQELHDLDYFLEEQKEQQAAMADDGELVEPEVRGFWGVFSASLAPVAFSEIRS